MYGCQRCKLGIHGASTAVREGRECGKYLVGQRLISTHSELCHQCALTINNGVCRYTWVGPKRSMKSEVIKCYCVTEHSRVHTLLYLYFCLQSINQNLSHLHYPSHLLYHIKKKWVGGKKLMIAFFFPVPVARETNSLKYFLMSEKEAVMFPFPRKKPEMVYVLW